MADLFRLDIRTENSEQAVAVTGLLAIWLAAGWEELDAGPNILIFRIYAERKDFLEQLQRQLKLAPPGVKCEIAEIKKQDWTASWQEFFTPVKCGKRFVALPPWLSREDFGKRIKIIIEPASAFGTGHHATTALCLTALSELLDEGAIREGQTFLDLGCGSGILGIGAALSGLSGIGVDNDVLAVENALRNRAMNSAASLRLHCGSLEQAAGKHYDLIMANTCRNRL